ncbi:MAG: 4'-phosphopantetheinyl transferase superfamily protein, partial [Longimicrobiales bacterium]|nr:4'-phosphopantetheinyl transferase superfamily protein [Longimicrobiales bacterium]
MLSPWHLGNDIVDLADPRHAGKARDERFLQRVFSDEEQADIRSSQNPDRALWLRWAGKEAAFKSISKSLGVPPTFIHPLFQVVVFRPVGPDAVPDGAYNPPMTRFGQVRHGEILLPLRIEVIGTAVHA